MSRTRLSPRQLAQAIGVSESSMKRWIDAGRLHAHRTSGGHRRVPLAEAIRFVRENGLTIVSPDLLGLPESQRHVDLREGDDAVTQELTQILVRGSTTDAQGLIVGLYLKGQSVAAICDGPIRRALAEVGVLWREREDGVLLEHRATEICIKALHHISSLIETRDGAPVAVGGAPPGDPYALPSLASAVALEAVGFRAVNLGPDTPLPSLVLAARREGAKLAWLSLSAPIDRGRLVVDVPQLAIELRAHDCRLVVGGRALEDTSLLHALRSVDTGGTLAELVAFARGLHP